MKARQTARFAHVLCKKVRFCALLGALSAQINVFAVWALWVEVGFTIVGHSWAQFILKPLLSLLVFLVVREHVGYRSLVGIGTCCFKEMLKQNCQNSLSLYQ